MRIRLHLTLFGIGAALMAASAADKTAPAKTIRFNRDIRPILSDNCFSCHGPDQKKRKAKLRLDERESAVGKGAVVPGKPDESELIRRIFEKDPEEMMPPPESTKKLTDEQKQTLKQWIAQGAPYEPHWSYIVPRRPAVPRPRTEEWAVNPIDDFILAALEEHGMTPSKEADRRTLIRRLSLDLTGLPPTALEVESFVKDRSPRAYEKLVDRLLASPPFGERMAVPWLDLVRFSDTVGYHGDQNVNVFPYREYVIRAFNQNKPFDQFTIEQIAGDLLPNPTTEQRVATGFNRLNMVTREGGAQPKEYIAKYQGDRVRTVATTWLGSTMACCECHDHKFDPFTTRDFYSLSAFFADIRQWGVYSDYVYTPNPDLKGFSNDHPFPPEIEVPSEYLQHRQQQFLLRLKESGSRASTLLKEAPARKQFAEWRKEIAAFLAANPSGWISPAPRIQEPKPDSKMARLEGDRSIVFTSEKVSTDKIVLEPGPGWVSALRMELLPRPEHDGKISRKGRAIPQFQFTVAHKTSDKETMIPVYFADADIKEARFDNGYAVIGTRDLWRLGKDLGKPQTEIAWLEKPVRLKAGDQLVFTLKDDPAGCLRISISPIVPNPPGSSAAYVSNMQKAVRKESSWKLPEVAGAYFVSTGKSPEWLSNWRSAHREWLDCRDGKSPTVVTEAMKPITTRVLPRGNWLDESGEIVKPAPPHFLPGAAAPSETALTRLDLAKWLVSPENPLTARVFVNRLWKQMFGNGLCNTVDDFGAQGESPSHPELLDWLAVEFREGGWNVKETVKRIVMSRTYRQDSNLRKEYLESDPGNRLLSSQNPRRLEAEFVRDNGLFIAGILNLEIGGPSSKPYQPAGYYANIQFPNRDYIADNDDRQFRRGVYTHWQRTFLHPMMANFDAPSREECTANRTVSNTPQQALTLLNDPTFFEAARAFAQHLLERRKLSDEARLAAAFQNAVARPPKVDEKGSLLTFLQSQRAYYKEHGDEAEKMMKVGLTPPDPELPPAERAAWISVCRVILNLHETITRY